jgi:hypothetical protein
MSRNVGMRACVESHCVCHMQCIRKLCDWRDDLGLCARQHCATMEGPSELRKVVIQGLLSWKVNIGRDHLPTPQQQKFLPCAQHNLA